MNHVENNVFESRMKYFLKKYIWKTFKNDSELENFFKDFLFALLLCKRLKKVISRKRLFSCNCHPKFTNRANLSKFTLTLSYFLQILDVIINKLILPPEITLSTTLDRLNFAKHNQRRFISPRSVRLNYALACSREKFINSWRYRLPLFAQSRKGS